MTKELEQKAADFAQKYINHKMAIHDIFDLEVVQKDVTRLLIEFAAEVTKELEEEKCNFANKILDNWCRNKDDYCPHLKALEKQIEKMKNCRNCKNEKIKGACGHFTQVGWCKNWELAK